MVPERFESLQAHASKRPDHPKPVNRACDAAPSPRVMVTQPRLDTYVGADPFATAMQRLDRFAGLPYPVLIRGETGTGKELAATRLHKRSIRSGGPLVAINCAAISSSLAESELFGHRRGAFTGAMRDHAGAFERASGGTLFLDEVAELPLALQAKLLRVLETGRYLPVGAERELCSDVRIVAATHRDLESMAEAGSLRQDFIYRLCVLVVELPPLRRRLAAIEPLANVFLREVYDETGISVQLSPAAVTAARNHNWPGNVRELKNRVRRAAALAHGSVSAIDLFPAQDRPVAPRPTDEIRVPRGSYISMRRHLLQAVVTREGSVRKAAKRLNVARSTLADWLRDHDGTGEPPPA
ncbi:MAG: hypothetical protein B7733_25195 [Myxococcales bacterium FL481]|nr:MAG: hypothetical protein B7733_25195 [Myxococcales bacterium FL481]